MDFDLWNLSKESSNIENTMLEPLEKISTNGKWLFLAYDHGFEHGPVDLPGRSLDPYYVLGIAEQGKYNAVILQKGTALRYYKGSKFEGEIPLIVKINGKASIRQGEPLSLQNCSLKFAKEVLGAVAVGYTIYLGSENDPQMFAEFGRIVEEAHALKMGAIAWIYPRGAAVQGDDSGEITAYAARIGMELGADMVKIKYSGTMESFHHAVASAGDTKVVLSGGVRAEQEEQFLHVVTSVMDAGAHGVAVGRNVWQAEDPFAVTKDLRDIVFSDAYLPEKK